MTLAGAEKAVGSAIMLPNLTSVIRASGAPADRIRLSLGPVWANQGAVALTFNRGTVAILAARAIYKNPSQAFRAELSFLKKGAQAALGLVNGKPAVIIEPRTDYIKSNPALVEFYLRGLDLKVISTTVDTKLLLAIAESIKD